mgnify:CR=1 FL=1
MARYACVFRGKDIVHVFASSKNGANKQCVRWARHNTTGKRISARGECVLATSSGPFFLNVNNRSIAGLPDSKKTNI